MTYNPHRCDCGCLKLYGCDEKWNDSITLGATCGEEIIGQDVDCVWKKQDFSHHLRTNTNSSISNWNLAEFPLAFTSAKSVIVRYIARNTWTLEGVGPGEFRISIVKFGFGGFTMCSEEVQPLTESWTLYETSMSINEDHNTRSGWLSCKFQLELDEHKFRTYALRAIEVCID